MKIALYYRHRHGGVYRRITEIQKRSRYDVEIVSELPRPGDYDIVHSYSDSHGGRIHTAECNMCQAIDFSKRFSKYALKHFAKGLDELYNLRRYERIVAKSERDFNFLKKFGFHLSLIRAGVDLDAFKPGNVDWLREKLRLENKKVVLFVSRIEEAKGVILVLRAAPLLPEGWVLLIIGEPAASATGIKETDKIRFLGPVPHDEIVDYYNLADVFCLPSWTECFPLTILEALACGKPVIATDVGDIRKILEPPLGGYICGFDQRDIAKKVVEAEKSVDGRDCRRVASKYTWAETVQKEEKVWEEIYRG